MVADEKGVHCFACGEGGDIFWFHAKLTGLPFTDVLKELAEQYAPHLLSNNGNENGKHLKKIIATYPYQDETGKLLFQVVKYEPKDFLFRHPDSEGGWIWNLKSVRRVLYRLPILLASFGTVYIPGGEKDCETLINLGMTATAIGVYKICEFAPTFFDPPLERQPQNKDAEGVKEVEGRGEEVADKYISLLEQNVKRLEQENAELKAQAKKSSTKPKVPKKK